MLEFKETGREHFLASNVIFKKELLYCVGTAQKICQSQVYHLLMPVRT